jgi:hypothetical protein
MEAIAVVATPPIVDRVGLRYIDRLKGNDLSRLDAYVLPQLRVMYGAVGEGLTLEHSVSDSLIRIANDERMQVRSGLLPQGASFDAALAPLQESAWVLDRRRFHCHGRVRV